MKAVSIEYRFPAAHTFKNQTLRYPVEMQIRYKDFFQEIHDELIVSLMLDYGNTPDRVLNQLNFS